MRYQQLAEWSAAVGQFGKALEFLRLSEECTGETPWTAPAAMARLRAGVYTRMNRTDLALDSYIRSYAFEMNPMTRQKIATLATARGVEVEAAYALARTRRTRQLVVVKPFVLKTIEGGAVSLDTLRARAKATLVTFFFPACGPCNAEFPHIQGLFEKYREAGFTVVAVNTDPAEDGDIASWQSKMRLTFPIVLSPSPDYAEKVYGVRLQPTDLLLDQSGRVAFRHPGPVGLQTLEEEIQELLRGTPAR
jgi:thiol-disulfide isomerase/thioredoxin